MTIREILVHPDKRLTEVAKKIEVDETGKFSPEIVTLCADLKETVKAYEAEGLASTQIGVPHRVFVVKTENNEYKCCINPEIVAGYEASDGPSIGYEGCLSFPSVNEKIRRYAMVDVKYLTEDGTEVTERLTEIRSVAFQHELDHLNGVLFIDKMGSAQKYLALKKLAKLKRTVSRKFKRYVPPSSRASGDATSTTEAE